MHQNLGNIPFKCDGRKYAISDPCYILEKFDWTKLCEDIFMPNEKCVDVGVFRINGYLCWFGSTKYGDGLYTVMNGDSPIGQFGVDAGMFGIFPLELVESLEMDTKLFVVATLDGEVEYLDGNLWCGDVEIITGNNEDD